jgi:hypothetical protein
MGVGVEVGVGVEEADGATESFHELGQVLSPYNCLINE